VIYFPRFASALIRLPIHVVHGRDTHPLMASHCCPVPLLPRPDTPTSLVPDVRSLGGATRRTLGFLVYHVAVCQYPPSRQTICHPPPCGLTTLATRLQWLHASCTTQRLTTTVSNHASCPATPTTPQPSRHAPRPSCVHLSLSLATPVSRRCGDFRKHAGSCCCQPPCAVVVVRYHL
jgi:hypothetical protein